MDHEHASCRLHWNWQSRLVSSQPVSLTMDARFIHLKVEQKFTSRRSQGSPWLDVDCDRRGTMGTFSSVLLSKSRKQRIAPKAPCRHRGGGSIRRVRVCVLLLDCA